MKPIRLAVVGTNFISDRFVEAARLTGGVEIAAVVSRAKETADRFADRHGIPARYVGLPAALADDTLDALYIATPNGNHKDASIAALRAGKHVLCEKIVTTNAENFRLMRAEAKGAGKVLLEAMRPAFDPVVTALRDAMPKIGTLRRAVFPFCQYSSRYDKCKAGIYTNAFDPSLGNAALFDIGIYPLHLAVSLLGVPRDLSGYSVFLPGGFEGAGELLLDYTDRGFTATVTYSKIADSDAPVRLEGEAGTLTLDKINAPSTVTFAPRGGTPEVLFRKATPNNMIYEIDAFAAMCRGEISPEPYLDLTDAVMATVDRAVAHNRIFS